MSFSSDLKNELSMVIDRPRHCRIAELGAVALFAGKTGEREGKAGADNKEVKEGGLTVSSENPLPACVCAELVRKIYQVRIPVTEKTVSGKGNSCFLDFGISGLKDKIDLALEEPYALLTKRCCKCAFLRGAFIAAGTISDPDRSYHLEFLCRNRLQAETLCGILSDIGVNAKTIQRKKYLVVYVKDSEMISDVLGSMGARISLLELENKRIIRGTRGVVNRRVNCETANINRTATAAAAQIAAIKKIEKYKGLSSLPDGLDEIAELRLEYPAATLQELGQMLDTPIGKSGVNHRLRKIIEISETCDILEVT